MIEAEGGSGSSRKMSGGDFAKILAERFPDAEVKVTPIAAGSRKLGTRRGPHVRLRACIKPPGLAECAGAAMLPEAPTAKQLESALSEMDGQLAAALDAAQIHAAEQERINARQRKHGGKRNKGEALEEMGS
jgi:hypothetical protein